jgi:hypothetical protein
MPTSFKDTEGRAWCLDLTIASIKRVKSITDIDLLNIQDGSALLELSRDPLKLVDLLWAIISPQANELKITDEQFGSSLGGLALRDASEAFLTAITSFFQQWSPAMGETLLKLHTKISEMDLKASELTRAKLADPRIDEALEKTYQRVEQEMETALNNLSTAGNSSPNALES